MTLPSIDQLFPMGIKDLMHHLEGIVKNWFQLGMELGLPVSKLEEIEYNNPSNVLRCKRLMLQEWQRRPTLKPSWCTLVDALCSIKENTAADKISQQFSELYFRSILVPDPIPTPVQIVFQYPVHYTKAAPAFQKWSGHCK